MTSARNEHEPRHRPRRASRFTAVVIVIAMLGSLRGARADELDDAPTIALASVLRRAASDPPSVKLALATLGRYEAERRYAQGRYVPVLTGLASGGITYDNRLVLPELPRIDSKSLIVQGNVSLDFAALDLAREPAIDAARAAERAAGFGVDSAAQGAMLAAAELYFRASAAAALVRDAAFNVERRSSQLTAVSDLTRAGIRPPVDAQRAEIEAVSARYVLEGRRQDARAACAALSAAMGQSAARLLCPEPLDLRDFAVSISPARARELASHNRPELRRLSAMVDSRREEHSAAIAARLPVVGVSANGNASYLDVKSGVGISGSQFGGSALGYVRWNGLDPAVWFRGGVTDAAASEAERQLAATVQAVTNEAVQAAYTLEHARVELERAVAILGVARATRESQNGRYRSGMASLLELLDAENLEQDARQRRIEAERDHAIAVARLIAACGLIHRGDPRATLRELTRPG
jgi:outer membrane protein